MTTPTTRLFLVGLVAMTAIGPMAMQIFVPALPIIQHYFAVHPGLAQLALSLSMAFIAVTTLIYGPLSDRYGRRPVVFAGLAIFLLGSIICALADSIALLIIGRAIQAAGGASGMVLARAIVRDVYPSDQVAKVIAYLTIAMVVAPMISPFIGGLLTDLINWRAIFTFVGLCGLVVVGLVIAGVGETHQPQRGSLGFRAMIGTFAVLLRSTVFCGYALQGAFSLAAFFAFAAAAPYVMIHVMNRPATEYGVYFIFLSLSFMTGNFVAARLSQGLGTDRMVLIGSGIALAVTMAGLLLLLWGPWVPLAIFIPAMAMVFSNGLSMPNALAGALEVSPNAAGTASGLAGFLQMAIAAVFAQAVGHVQDGTPYPMYGFMIFGSACSLTAIVIGLRAKRRAAARLAEPGRAGPAQ